MKRRILFCTYDYFPAPAGGAERQARLQAEELRRRGHEVVVVCPRARGYAGGVVNGVRVYRLPCIDKPGVKTLSYLPMLALFLVLRLRSFDLAHVHLANLQADAIVVLGRLLRRPVYVKLACGGVAGEVARLRRVSWATRYVGMRGATCLQALSEEIVEEAVGVGVSAERIVRIPNGLDLGCYRPTTPVRRQELRQQLGLPDTLPIALFTGRFARYKGLADLLAVQPEIRSLLTLVLVGSPAIDQPLGPIASSPGLVVRGWTKDVADYMQAADIYVSPTYADGMSNALLEAMGCGLAIVATRVASVLEMIVDEESGLLIEPGDRGGLEAALRVIAGDVSLRKRLGEAAVSRARAFDITRVVDRIEAVYDHILDGAGLTAPRLQATRSGKEQA